VRKSIRVILEKEGFEVTSVASGAAALEKMVENTFDLILLDVMMPDMSGWELFTHMTEINKKYRVIFLTVLEISQERLVELTKSGIYFSKTSRTFSTISPILQSLLTR